jgi:hypothetical protein
MELAGGAEDERGQGACGVEVAQAAGEVAVAGVVPREQPQQRRERLLPWSVVTDSERPSLLGTSIDWAIADITAWAVTDRDTPNSLVCRQWVLHEKGKFRRGDLPHHRGLLSSAPPNSFPPRPHATPRSHRGNNFCTPHHHHHHLAVPQNLALLQPLGGVLGLQLRARTHEAVEQHRRARLRNAGGGSRERRV